MLRNSSNSERLSELRQNGNCEKYLLEYEKINDQLVLVSREEVFSELVKLMKLCKKMQIPLPHKYMQYYLRTKSKLSVELKCLEKKVAISQINNENYTHLEERINEISKKLGFIM